MVRLREPQNRKAQLQQSKYIVHHGLHAGADAVIDRSGAATLKVLNIWQQE